MKVEEVKLSVLPNTSDELAISTHSICDFCGKNVRLFNKTRYIYERMSGENRFFCSFCLKHGFHTKNRRNVLVVSYRAIFGFYYYWLYCDQNLLAYSQISDFIESHAETGGQLPVCHYDRDSFLWFFDFSKVGNKKRQIPLSVIIKNVINTLVCFDLLSHVPEIKTSILFAKYLEAIDKFYQNRYRPEGKKHLIPTLSGCMSLNFPTISKNKFDYEITRNFTPQRFILRD